MCIRLYAVESMLYRVAGSLDAMIAGSRENAALLAALEELAVEASIVKVAGSEMMDFVVDENVQIHGGNGFVRDYAAERHYRDARVNRIFEGTNEINRTLIPAMMVRKLTATGGVGAVSASWSDDGINTRETVNVIRFTTLAWLLAASQAFGKTLTERQEVLAYLADMLIDLFACDSVVARAEASADRLHQAVADVFVADAVARVYTAARNLRPAVPSHARGDASAGLRAVLDLAHQDTITLRRQIAEAALARRRYPFV
jgi:alkylation response protein AidB-like acyl-CoA dehydrogenase